MKLYLALIMVTTVPLLFQIWALFASNAPLDVSLILLSLSAIPVVVCLVIVFLGGNPLLAIFKAKLMKTPLIILATKRRTLEFIAEKKSSDTVEDKQYGTFFVNPEGIFVTKNGIPAGIAWEDFGILLTPEFVASTAQLKAQGINSILEADEVKEKVEKELEKKPEEAGKFAKLLLPIQSVNNFFRYNVNPKWIRARIAESAADLAEQYSKSNIVKWILITGIFLVCAAIAYSIATQGGGIETVKELAGSFQQTTTTIPRVVGTTMR